MKKRTCTMMTAAILLTALCGSGSLPTGAEEALILTRDTDGTLTVSLEEQETVSAVQTQDEYDYTYSYSCYSQLNVREGENGQAFYHGEQFEGNQMYAVTDSTGMPSSYTFDDAIYPFMDDGLTDKKTPPYTAEIISHEVQPGDEDFPLDGEELLKAHGEGARIFRIEGIDPLLEINAVYDICLNDPHVLDLYEAILITEGNCLWTGDFVLHSPIPEHMIDPETLEFLPGYSKETALSYYFGDELAKKLNALTEERKTWLASYSAWRDTVDYNSMTEQERADSLKAAGIMNRWEITKKAIDLAAEFEAKYEEVSKELGIAYDIQVADLRFTMIPGTITESRRTLNIWDEYGDVSYDGSVDAADASQILSNAAKLGSSDMERYASYNNRCDFNLDGHVNASDAADLLIYLADKGAGNSQPLKEYIASLRTPQS